MITVEFDEKCELPAMSEPSLITWQAKKLVNTTTGEPIVNGMKRAFREYRFDENMRLYEKTDVYSTVGDAMYRGSVSTPEKERKWVETSLGFEMVLVGRTDSHFYRYDLRGLDGVVESVELLEKRPV